MTTAAMATATLGNQRKMSQLESNIERLLADALRRGFYGKAGIELSVQDGTIQQITCRIERVER